MTKSRAHLGLGLVLFITSFNLVTTGCSSVKPKHLDYHVNLGQKMSALDQEVKQDLVSHAALLAPTELGRAEAAVGAARRALFAAERRDRILRRTGLAEAHLEVVRRRVSERQPVVADLLAQREAAINAGALRFTTTRAHFERTDLLFRERFPATEARRAELNRTYRGIEVTAVSERVLRTTREQLAEARRLDARRAAPVALATAERAYQSAEDAIRAEPRRAEAFVTPVKTAENLSRALVAIAAQARVVGARSDEEVARELLLQKQRLGQLRAELNGVELDASVRERRLRELSRESRLNALLERTRQTLGEDAAHVFRAGDRLLIQLKNDPTAAATLDKVKGVLRDVNARDVLVRGGSPRRAEAVTQSLNEVTAVGRMIGPESPRVEVSLRPELRRR